MIRKVAWWLFISLVIRGSHCSQTERDLYAFSTLVNAQESSTDGKSFEDKVQDAETAETNTYSNPYGGTTEFMSQDVAVDDSEDDPLGPEDHVIPYSEHENPKEVPTKPNYVAPGTWAKPDPKKNIPLDFVPTKTLAQVRGTHTVKVLPQSEAISSARSDEERENAPRLREVVSKKKTNTIYTEEGYEDSAYDHGGHIRDADFHEGYARKLHDERGSKARSGAGGRKKLKKKKSKNNDSFRHKPDEFEEFTDDYSDESAPSDKYKAEGSSTSTKKNNGNKIYKEMWKKPDVNPKIVTENEIEKLEHDLKRETEEAEKGSENYDSGTKRDFHRDYNGGETNTDDSQYSEESRSDTEKNAGFPSFGTKENFYKENYEATTIQFETPTPGESDKYEASTSNYENPTTNKYYLPDGSAIQENYEATTFNYDYGNNPQSVVGDTPTTANYGEIFWQYFRDKPNVATSPSSYLQEQTTIQQPISVRETTTLVPFEERSSPLAVATINGHGPYLLVSENGEGTQNPNQFGVGDFSHFGTPQNGHQYINPNAILNHGYDLSNSQGITSRSGENFSPFTDSRGPEKSEYGDWGSINEVNRARGEPPTTRFYDNIGFSSTPTYSLLTLPPTEYKTPNPTLRQDSSYRGNPFLNSVGKRNSYNHENFEAWYKKWPTNNKKSPVRDREQSTSEGDPNNGPSPSPLNSKSHGNKAESFFGYKPNLDYTKMLSFIKSHQNGRYDGQKSESIDPKDFTIMKPPALRESAFSDFTLNSYPNVAGYSSVTQESEAVQEVNKKRVDNKKNSTKHNGLSQKDRHFKTPTFYGNKPPAGVNRNKLFPASKLLPPPPSSRNSYANPHFSNRNNGYYGFSNHPSPQYNSNYGNGVRNYSPDPEQLARYLHNRNAPPRHTRSLDDTAISEERIANALIAREINARFNFTSEDQGSTKYRDVGILQKQKLRVKRNLIPEESQTVTEDLPRFTKEISLNEELSKIHNDDRLRNKRSHQDLLDASHKIAGDVIDGEIHSRFKSKDYDIVDEEDDEEEEDDETRREKQVEVDVPDLDYLDEIQDVNDIENIPTTTIASIDFQKYPFYKNTKVSHSPLRYIINPKEVPKKTFGGMEFYDSRDKYVQCDEVDPNLEDVAPDGDEEPVPNRGPKENLPRLRGLGDKLDCFKAKYFGQNPFDNPLFFERKINQPTPPTELDPMKLVTRILELPKENERYLVPAQSRKPENMAIKRIDNNRRGTKSRNFAETKNVKSSVEPRNRRRNNAIHSKIEGSSTRKPQTESRRTRKRRPARTQPTTTTEFPEMNSVTPYQKEVYDDVMGTIKNLASLYEMFGAQTVAPITEATILSPNADHIRGAPNIRNVKMLNRVPTFNGKKEIDSHSSGISESPFHEEIEGLLPPPELNKKIKIVPYRTNKVSYNTRVRTETPARNGDKKIIGYFRTVMVHKRSLDDYAGAPIDPETETSKHTAKKRYVIDSEFVETQRNSRSLDSNAFSSTTERPKRGRRRKTSLASTTTTTVAPVTSDATTEAKDETRKPSYTIRSRSRNAKEDKTTNRYGLFTTTRRPSATIDGRRNELRYTEIMRRRGPTAGTTTTTPSPEVPLESNSTTLTAIPEVHGSIVAPVMETKEIYKSENSVPSRRKVRFEEVEPSGEIYKAIASDFEPEHVEEGDEESENYEEEEEEEEESTDEPVKNISKYDVYEDVQEDTTPSVVGFPKPAKTSEHVDLETYLSTDPPGFSRAFADEPGTTVPYKNADERGDDKDNYRNEESKEEQIEEGDEEHAEAPKNASYQEEESSEEDGTQSPRTSEFYKDSSNENADESADQKTNSEKEDGDDKTFFRYNTRPDSPFESFEDDKYAELGPRVNKPAFHHPLFEAPKYERHYFDDSEEKEKDKTDESSETGKYVFPWAHDEEDEKAEAQEGYVEETTEKYEYPWEKRERLAEERAQRRKDRERLKKLQDFSFLHDDDDDYYEDDDEKKASSSKTSGKHAYPWDLYDVPSKAYKKNFWTKKESDSDETSSEHRPVAKFSSKYSSSKFKLPFADSEPITVAQPKKIRDSVLKYLKEADENTFEPTVAYESEISTTKTPEPAGRIEATKEPVSSGSKNNKRISNSRIIPENITIAPRNRSRSRVTPVRDRSTLRPSVKSTTETVVVAKTQTTPAPVLTTKRPLRVRGGLNALKRQPSYKAQESQIESSTVLPTPKSMTTSTTEEPVKPLTMSPVRFAVRKRGKPKSNSNTVKTNTETSRQTQKDVTEKSTEATTAIRRRTRPTGSTRIATSKTVHKNYERPKRPSRVDTRNSLKETTHDQYRIPTMSSINSGDRNAEDSTPTSRTVEHRSRVSKEEIITKTSFPDQDTMYKVHKDKNLVRKKNAFNDNTENESSSNRKPNKSYSQTPDRVRKLFGKTNAESENPVKNESVEKLSITTKETPEHVYEKKEILDKDGHKGMFISIVPKNRTVGPSALEDELHLKKAKMEEFEKPKEQGYEDFNDTVTQNAESNGGIGSTYSDDSFTPGHELRKIPHRSNQLKEPEDSYNEEYASSEKNSSAEPEDRYKYEDSNEGKEVDETEEKSSVVNFEKDPSQRAYYYLDYKK